MTVGLPREGERLTSMSSHHGESRRVFSRRALNSAIWGKGRKGGNGIMLVIESEIKENVQKRNVT